MPLILATPQLCSYVEADTVLSVLDVVVLGEVHELWLAAQRRAK